MYSEYYGFSEKPFDITPDPRFLFMTPGHQEALATLLYGIRERRGFIAMVGEVGTGKTTLLNAILERLDQNIQAALIFNTDIPFQEILNVALFEWGLIEQHERLSKAYGIQVLNRFAIDQQSKGGNVVLIIDEAQHLSVETMENLRLLSNLETAKQKLIQIVLSGQPELDEKLGCYELRQLAQRITLKRRISPLNEKETYAYLDHRLACADYSGKTIFKSRSKQLIWEYSGGIPRKINILCDNTMLMGYGLKLDTITASVILEAVHDLGWDNIHSQHSVPPDITSSNTPSKLIYNKIILGLAIVASVIILATILEIGGYLDWYRSRDELKPAKTATAFVKIQQNGSSENLLKQYKNKEQSDHEVQNEMISSEGRTISDDVTDASMKKSAIDSNAFSKKHEMVSTNTVSTTNIISNKTVSGQSLDIKTIETTKQSSEGDFFQPFFYVKVKPGQGLYSVIIDAYGSSPGYDIRALYNLNVLNSVLSVNPEITDSNKIYKGQQIRIPVSFKNKKELNN